MKESRACIVAPAFLAVTSCAVDSTHHRAIGIDDLHGAEPELRIGASIW